MNNKIIIRNGTIFICLLLFVIIAFIKEVKSYVDYSIATILILGCIKTIMDHYFGLSMRVGFSGDVPYVEKNKSDRIHLVILSIVLAIFGLWWIANKTF